MRKKEFIAITALACCFVAFAGKTPCTNMDVTDLIHLERLKNDKIALSGWLKSKGGLRSGTDPIVAEQQGAAILVRFQQEVGVVLVTVIGEQGEAFIATVDTASQHVLAIPLTGLPKGRYAITFSNEWGTMWGEVEV